MSLWFILMVLGLHWLFDFVFQTPQQAEGKSKSFLSLWDHCSMYCLWGLVIPLFFSMTEIGCFFFLYLLGTHLVIDGVTSRITAWLWKEKRVHDFFVMIGADQILHYVTIFWYLDLMKL